ncbi:MAG: hypothetical protein GX803_09235 [Lentisphaerae bacterium]|jgi:hypothetical protein|nr:hypothetical protein [Lentisphaerota bacterium]
MVTPAYLFLGRLLVVLGTAGLAVGGVMVAFPAGVLRGLVAFPRWRTPGWIMTALAVFWVGWIMQHAALGRFEWVKPYLPFAAVGLYLAVLFLLDELLSARALGALLILVANPMLMGVRWAESIWRHVPAVIAYVWVLVGCALMLHPWLFRKTVERFLPHTVAVRRWGWIKLAGSILLLAAGLWHLP